VQAEVTRHAAALAARGIRVVSWFPGINGDGLDHIGVTGLTRAGTRVLDRLFGAGNIALADIPRHGAPVPESSRRSDVAPWNGGDFLYNDEGGCTAGVGITFRKHRYMITAAHCFTRGSKVYNGDGGKLMGTVASRDQRHGGDDTELIATKPSNVLWTGATDDPAARPLIGAEGSPDGAIVCNEGAYSGELCSTVVSDDPGCIDLEKRVACGIDESSSSGIASEQGDSGGPVVRYTGAGNPEVTGIVNAGNAPSVPCADKVVKCSRILFYTAIGQILTREYPGAKLIQAKTVAYVSDANDRTVTPVSTRTRKAGKPIPVPAGVGGLAAAPDGKVVYAATGMEVSGRYNWVVPISTATNRPGPKVTVGPGAVSVVVTPDGRTAYVASYEIGSLGQTSVITPINTSTDTAGAPIEFRPWVPVSLDGNGIGYLTMAPDQKAVYAIAGIWPKSGGGEAFGLVPFGLPGGVQGAPATLPFPAGAAITPDGRTIYVIGVAGMPDASQPELIPVSAGGGAGAPIPLPAAPIDVAVTPDGKTAYVTGTNTVIPVNLRTRTAGPAISLKGTGVSAIAITPDGKTAYILAANAVIPVNLTTNKPGRPIAITSTADTDDSSVVIAIITSKTTTPGTMTDQEARPRDPATYQRSNG
jgi:DNA-binding beta-propeller fold protein YncE